MGLRKGIMVERRPPMHLKNKNVMRRMTASKKTVRGLSLHFTNPAHPGKHWKASRSYPFGRSAGRTARQAAASRRNLAKARHRRH
jgi:hypothetical protein